MSDYITKAFYIAASVIIVTALMLAPGHSIAQGKNKEWVIVIDPGHGGRDPGAIGGAIKEKDITLAIAIKLGKHLSKLENTKVIYTRETDETVELYKRPKKANESKADLFISIHCNSVESSKPYGAETWVMGLHRSKANLEVAKAENSVILLEDDYQTRYDGFDPNSPEAEIIFSLYQNAYLDQSVDFASMVQKELRTNSERFDRGVKQAGFLVLYKINMPGILVEAGFLSNENERKFLASDAGQNSIATSIYNAVINYREKVDGVKPRVKPGTPIVTTENKAENKPAVNQVSTTVTPNSPDVITDTPTVDTKNNNKQVEVSEKPGAPAPPKLYFSVQFLSTSYQRKLSDPLFSEINDVHFYAMDGIYRYVAGYFLSFEQANVYKNVLISKEFKDAFIVAFHDGKRIPVSEAKELQKK